MNTIESLQQEITKLQARYDKTVSRAAYTIGDKLRAKLAELKQAQVNDLSKEFSRLVNKYYTAEQLAAVRAKNAKNNDSTCATHDFYDANMIMDEAFQTVMKREYVFWNDEEPGTFEQNEYDTDLINEAWGLSKVAAFYNIG